MISKRNRTSSERIYNGLHLYFLGLSLRNSAKALPVLHIINRSRVLLAKKWYYIQKYKPRKVSTKRTKIEEYIVDETLIKVGSEYTWLWAAIEPENKRILPLSISNERNMLIAERFISDLVEIQGKHVVSTDAGGTWYPMACKFLKLKLKHYIHSFF